MPDLNDRLRAGLDPFDVSLLDALTRERAALAAEEAHAVQNAEPVVESRDLEEGIDDALAGLAGILPDEQPAAVECSGGCGAAVEWEPRHFRSGREAWVRGANPCHRCEALEPVREAARTRQTALRRAKLPPKLWGWDLGHVVVQGPGEDVGTFMARAKHSEGRPLGVLRPNAEVVAEVARWAGAPFGSLYLFGEVGQGKSTLAAALVELLAVPVDLGYRTRTVDEMAQHYGPTKAARISAAGRRCKVVSESREVLYIDEAELMARVEASWSGDKDPLAKVARVGLLVLDDLGVELVASRNNSKRQDMVAKAMERLVSYRYDHGLPMVITSNLSWARIVEEYAYGRRVGDRLREMVDGNYWQLHGPSWRQPPEPAAERRRAPVVERVSAAAGDPVLL